MDITVVMDLVWREAVQVDGPWTVPDMPVRVNLVIGKKTVNAVIITLKSLVAISLPNRVKTAGKVRTELTGAATGRGKIADKLC